MFSEEKSNISSIRFNEFTNAWEQEKLSNLGKTYSGLSGKTKKDFGHGNAKYVTYLNVFKNPITSIYDLDLIKKDTKQNSVKYGDIFVTTSSETPEEVGMTSVWSFNIENVYLNSFCFSLRFDNIDSYDIYFLANNLRNKKMRKKIILLAQGISRFNISKQKFMNINIDFPNINEQNKIGQTFRLLNNLITLHHRKLKAIENIKKTLLDKMFPDAKFKISSIKSKKFTHTWEQEKLGNLLNYYNGVSNEANQLNKGKYKIINLNSISTNGYLKPSGKFLNYSKETLKKDDIVIILSDIALGKLLGMTAVIPSDNEYVLNQRVGLLRNNNYQRIDSHFISFCINRKQKEIMKKGGGSSQLNLSKWSVINFKINMTVLKEQEKISKLFNNLKTLITLHQRKLKALENIKKTLLDKMFPDEKSNIPSIRFKEFTNAWEQEKLGNISTIFTGEFIHQNMQSHLFKFPVYNGGTNFTGFYKYFNQEKGKIVMSSRGIGAGFANYVDCNFWAGNSVFSINVKESHLKFVFWNLKKQKKQISKLIKNSGIPSLLLNDVLDILIYTTSSLEEQKISKIHDYLNNLITLHQRGLFWRENEEKIRNIVL
ncbi:restriction endonuclease subunit S [Mycoplasmopsis edwardii]|nr:restriction endonuclease subunit S [Mycoplasmopsis edwardii]